MVSSKKKVLSAFLSLAMIGSMVAAVPLTASAAETTTTATPVVTYSVHQQSYGWESTVTGPATAGVTGQSKRLEALKINAPSGATISYSVHQQTYGWEAAVSNGTTAGVTGQSKRLEAVKISLSGLPGYTIQYRVHQQTYGWENWVSNGAVAGVTGQSKRLEAIEIKLVPTVATVSAVNSTIGVGGTTTFAFKSADGTAYTPKTATYSLADASFGSIDSTGKFTAAKSGKAVVNVVADGVSLSTTVGVYGTATALTLTPAASTLVANGVTTDVVTATAVDSNGYAVGNYSGTATVDASGANSAFTTTATTLTFVNGVATFTVTAGTTPNTSGTVAVTSKDIKDSTTTSGFATVSATIGTVAQVGTSIKLTIAPYVSVNTATVSAPVDQDVTVAVLDQSGQPMTNSSNTAYTVAMAATGLGALSNSTVTVVNGSASAEELVYKGTDTGITTVTATCSGLTTAAASTTAVIGNTPVGLVLAGDSSNANGLVDTQTNVAATGLKFDLTTIDKNGYPDGNFSGTPDITIYNSSNVDVTSSFAPITYASGVFTINDKGTAADAGTYTVKAVDHAAVLTASNSIAFTITAGDAAKFTLAASSSVLSTSITSSTVTYQVVDTYGNPVSKSGDSVTFTATPNGSNKSALGQFAGGAQAAAKGSNAVYVTTTDATGKAVATFKVASPTDADSFAITAVSGNAYVLSGSAPSVVFEQTPTQSVAISFKAASGSTSTEVAGQKSIFTITTKNVNGVDNTSTNADTLKAVVSSNVDVSALTSGTDYTTDANGNYVLTGTASTLVTALNKIMAGKAGSVTVTLTDTTVGNVPQAAVSYNVVAGTATKLAIVGAASDGTLSVTVTANTPVAIKLITVDSEGNQVVNTNPINGTLKDSPATGSFQQTVGGVALTGGSITVTKATATVTVGYVNATAGTYTISLA